MLINFLMERDKLILMKFWQGEIVIAVMLKEIKISWLMSVIINFA